MLEKPVIAAIAAMSRNRVIGGDNKMLWHIPEDFKHFKQTTLGKPIIMGRKTYESLGRPLPGRTNIVISRFPNSIQGNVTKVSTLEEAISSARIIAAETSADEIFIIGGGQIYAEALSVTDRIYLTVIDRDYEGDAVFPELKENDWDKKIMARASEPVPYEIQILNRKQV